MDFSIAIGSSPMDPMDSIGTTFYPSRLSQHGWTFPSVLQIEHRLFHRNRFVSDGSPPLVGLFTSALPVFRSRGRGNDWNLVDSIGQPSDNDTGHHSRQDLLWNHWFIHACRYKQNFHGNLNGFLVTFSTIFAYLWRLSFRTLWRVWCSSEWHFLSLT